MTVKDKVHAELAGIANDHTFSITGGHACQFCSRTDVREVLSEMLDSLVESQQLISLPAITRILRTVLDKDIETQAGSTGASLMRGSTIRAHFVNHPIDKERFMKLNLVRRGPVLDPHSA